MKLFLGSPTTLGGGKIRLTMIPKSELVTVREESADFTRCKFALINFPSIWGENDVKRYPNPSKPGAGLIYQRFQLRSDPWLVDIIAVDSVMGVHFGLLQRGGSALTHTGTIVRTDGKQFSLDELKGFSHYTSPISFLCQGFLLRIDFPVGPRFGPKPCLGAVGNLQS